MFAESTLEISWGYRARRVLFRSMSFGLQAVVVGLLLMIPLLQTVGLPAVHTVSTPVNLGRPAPEPAPHTEGQRSRGVQIIPFGGRIMAPGRVPSGIPKGGGNVVMKGYYNDPEATAHAFRGGWFHTGDAAVVYPDGYAEIRDRCN